MTATFESASVETTSFEDQYFSGAALYGDDFDAARIARWYGVEARDPAEEFARTAPERPGYRYEYHALNHRHAFRFLAGRRFRQALAFGCAAGDDVAPIAGQVDRFLAVEPIERFWKTDIAGTPAEYRRPTLGGRIDCADGANDLTVCLHTLHHIPNAGALLAEFARITAPGGLFILREPISTMGDWRQPRRGLTANERGFPVQWLEERFARLGFTVRQRRFCSFPLTERLGPLLGVPLPYGNPLLVRLDEAACALTRWNIAYHRDSVRRKFAPGAVYYVLERDAVTTTPARP